MFETHRILLMRGVNLYAELNECKGATDRTIENWSWDEHERTRCDIETRIDEMCMLANLLGIASSEDFRKQIERCYELSLQDASLESEPQKHNLPHVRDMEEYESLCADIAPEIAIQKGLFELAVYLQTHTNEYIQFLFSGDIGDDEW